MTASSTCDADLAVAEVGQPDVDDHYSAWWLNGRRNDRLPADVGHFAAAKEMHRYPHAQLNHMTLE